MISSTHHLVSLEESNQSVSMAENYHMNEQVLKQFPYNFKWSSKALVSQGETAGTPHGSAERTPNNQLFANLQRFVCSYFYSSCLYM